MRVFDLLIFYTIMHAAIDIGFKNKRYAKSVLK